MFQLFRFGMTNTVYLNLKWKLYLLFINFSFFLSEVHQSATFLWGVSCDKHFELMKKCTQFLKIPDKLPSSWK